MYFNDIVGALIDCIKFILTRTVISIVIYVYICLCRMLSLQELEMKEAAAVISSTRPPPVTRRVTHVRRWWTPNMCISTKTVDKLSRVAFPTAFALFDVFYWSLYTYTW